MRNPRNRIEKFCYDHPDFGVPNLMKYVAIANVAIWLLCSVNHTLAAYFSFDAALILRGQVWRLLTFALYPSFSGILALVAYYFYYWIGSTLERQWGTPQFNIYFFSGVALMIVYGFLMYFLTGSSFSSGSIMYLYLSMFFSIAVLFPDTQVLFMFIIPIKMKYLAIADAVIFLWEVLSSPFPANLAPIVAVINFLIFCGDELFRSIPRSPSRGTINFRRESKRVRKEQESRLYTHKCSVCGRTDADYPELEFRYCSVCKGYHCFCSEHIGNHIHFTE